MHFNFSFIITMCFHQSLVTFILYNIMDRRHHINCQLEVCEFKPEVLNGSSVHRPIRSCCWFLSLDHLQERHDSKVFISRYCSEYVTKLLSFSLSALPLYIFIARIKGGNDYGVHYVCIALRITLQNVNLSFNDMSNDIVQQTTISFLFFLTFLL